MVELIPYFPACLFLDPALTELKSCDRQGPDVWMGAGSRGGGPVLQVRKRQENGTERKAPAVCLS